MKITFPKYILLLLVLTITSLRGATVTNIAAGDYHSLLLKSDGSLWAMGKNFGALGDGRSSNTNKPEQIVANGVKAVAAGAAHTLFLKSDGSLWATGDNSSGQLGDGTFTRATTPEQIVASGVIAIAAGDSHSLFIKSDGSLWAMGANSFGQLGDGTFISTNQPEQIVASGVIAVAGGDVHSLFVKSDGSLWGMGYNHDGQLGDGSLINTNKPEQIVASDVIAVAVGGGGADHSLFLKSDGSLWAMGYNGSGQLGDGTFNSTNRPEQIVANGVIAAAVGYGHSVFVKSDGSLWAMGDNGHGQLGDGTTDSGNYLTNQPEEIVTNGVVAVAGGYDHTLFLKSDGSLWAMGLNRYGELGDGFVSAFPWDMAFTPEQIAPSPQPVLNSYIASQTNLQFDAACGFGDTFYLLTSTNLAFPLGQWTPIWTNIITWRTNNIFSATLTNGMNSGDRQFYILQSQ